MPSQSSTARHGKGLGFLSLDAGGPRGISQLKILAEMMHRLNFDAKDDLMDRPCAVFDMIGGAGSGGFIAILLVIFGLTANDALDEFHDLCTNVLDKEGMDAEARTTALRDYISILMGKHGIDEGAHLLDQRGRSKGCKLIVPITYKHHAGSTCFLRNFPVRHEQTLNLTIGEALLATLATPPLFAPTSTLKDSATFEYMGADWTMSNPTQEIIAEAYTTFGSDEPIASVVNLGCGYPSVFAAPETTNTAEWYQFLERLTQDSERKAQTLESQMGQLGLFYRFSVSNGLESGVAPTASKDIVTHTKVYLADVAVSRKLDQCVESLRVRESGFTLKQIRHPDAQTILSPRLPPLTKTFVMRTEPWEVIEKTLLGPKDPEGDGPRMLVVTGIAGCGKTQIMLKFMKVHESKFANRFFVDGSSEDRIRADIIRNVRALGPDHAQKGFDECLAFLSQPSPKQRLFLYDNVDDPDIDLSSLLPHGDSCAIVITSRNQLLGESNPDSHLQLDIMSMGEAIELLLQGSGSLTAKLEQARKGASALAKALGCLPIALQQARSYMQQTKCSASSYLERLSRSRDKLLGQAIKHQLDMRAISTYAAFETSFGRLSTQAQKFLRLLSYFHWSGFPTELIILASKHRFSMYEWVSTPYDNDYWTGRLMLDDIFLRDGEWDVTNLDEITVSLQNFSLTTVLHGFDTTLLQLHPLVHEWVRSCIPANEKHNYQSASIVLLALGARNDHTAAMQYLPSHVNYMSGLWDTLPINEARAFGYILHENGIFQSALQMREMVVKSLRERKGEDNVDLSDTLWELGLTYRGLGKANQAAELQEEVLRLKEESYGERASATLAASNNLSLTFYDLGRFKEAAALQEKVLKLRKEVLGERHPDTITAADNLAISYRSMNRLNEAMVLQEEAARTLKEVLGEQHPGSMTVSSSLAVTYHELGRLQEAMEIQEEVSRLRKEVLGERHPDTIESSDELAITYRSMGRRDEAVALQQQAIKLWKEVAGELHPGTLKAIGNLAVSYLGLGRLEEALPMQLETLERLKKIRGERHHQTTFAMLALSETYIMMDREEDAASLLDAAEAIISEILGVEHSQYSVCQELKERVKVSAQSGEQPSAPPAEQLPAPDTQGISNQPQSATQGTSV